MSYPCKYWVAITAPWDTVQLHNLWEKGQTLKNRLYAEDSLKTHLFPLLTGSLPVNGYEFKHTRLQRKIGQLTMEVDFLKKVSSKLN